MRRWRKKREGLVIENGQRWWRVGNDLTHNLVLGRKEGQADYGKDM